MIGDEAASTEGRAGSSERWPMLPSSRFYGQWALGRLGAKWTRGLIVSQSGFTTSGLGAFGSGKSIVCMDGLVLHETLNRGWASRRSWPLRSDEWGRPARRLSEFATWASLRRSPTNLHGLSADTPRLRPRHGKMTPSRTVPLREARVPAPEHCLRCDVPERNLSLFRNVRNFDCQGTNPRRAPSAQFGGIMPLHHGFDRRWLHGPIEMPRSTGRSGCSWPGGPLPTQTRRFLASAGSLPAQ